MIAGPYKWAEVFEILQGFLDSLQLDLDAPQPANGFNIKPTQQVPIIAMNKGEMLLTTARWWFVPHWHKGDVKDWKATTFNAKIETAADKPTFRAAWANGRCLIPAQGYYEWTGAKGQKQPWYIAPQTNQPLFFFAGLASSLADGTRTCAVLTRAALPQISHLHPRSPVMLAQEELSPWMSGVAGSEIGQSWEGRMIHHPVRKFGLYDDGEELIERDGFAL
jgi:putative SOS response-associated peptidase YedK